ncbi:AMP-binding protein [bacterium]|nr:AMP-binding protein [bacterium]
MVYDARETIVGIAKQRAAEHGDRNYITFLEDGDDKEQLLSYGDLDRSARLVAAWLQSQGIKKGDRALVLLPNGLEFVKIFYGCLYGGVLAVPLSHQLGSYRETLIPNLKISKPRVLISTPQIADFLNKRLATDHEEFASIRIISDREILSQSGYSYQEPDITADDPAYLQFSSGSTGAPKGVIVGHSNIVANMEQSRIFGQWQEKSGTALWLPLFHDFGLAAGLIGSLYCGGFVVLMTPVHFILKPFRWLRAMSKYGCAHSYAPPFAFDMCLRKSTADDLKGINLSTMVSVVIGAEPVHYTATKKFNEYFAPYGLKSDVVRPGFGMAETVIMFSESPGLEVLCADRHLLEKKGTLKLIDGNTDPEDKKYLVNLGASMFGHEIVIMGENCEALPEGQVGEITLTGPSVCMGYYQNSEETEKVFNQRITGYETPFLKTGDLGLLWQGNLYFAGRIKDIIIIRGRNYYPHDIEFVVPKIKEVCPDCVIAYGVTDHEQEEQLALGIEIESEYLSHMDAFKEYVLPQIDKRVIKIIGDNFQIYPSVRTYLRPGTIKKTSSGKIKHTATIQMIEQEEFNGLLFRIREPHKAEEDRAELSTKDTIINLFKKIVEIEPVLDEPLIDLGSDSLKMVEFVESVEEHFAIPGLDLLEEINETTTLDDIIRIVEDENLQNLVPI